MTAVLITVDELRARLDEPKLRIADVRVDVAGAPKGEAAYRAAHVPGAIHAHLDRDLSDLSMDGQGRHPLPDAKAFARWLSRVGFAPDQAWIVYDDANGSFAARLWWMLRAVGHRDVRVLEGGYAAWVAAGAPVTDIEPLLAPTSVNVRYDESATADFAEVDLLRSDVSRRLVDARAKPRFRGEIEPLDPVAGHVPGAINRPFADNLEADGRFKSAEVLRTEWLRVLGGVSPERVVHMCGSGVTACHNMLAMEHAGLSGSRLFTPSWSGWVSDRSRPVATGDA